MIYEDICSKKTYTGKDGVEKTIWLKVGVMKTTDKGQRFIERNEHPNETWYVFAQKEKEASL